MVTFADSSGRQWVIKINIGAIMKVKEETGCDLLKILDNPKQFIDELLIDQVRSAQVIASLLSKQFEQVGGEDIYESFDGETLCNAFNAFLEELQNFFSQSGRTDKAEIIRKANLGIQAAINQTTTKAKEYQIQSGNKSGTQQDT